MTKQTIKQLLNDVIKVLEPYDAKGEDVDAMVVLSNVKQYLNKQNDNPCCPVCGEEMHQVAFSHYYSEGDKHLFWQCPVCETDENNKLPDGWKNAKLWHEGY